MERHRARGDLHFEELEDGADDLLGALDLRHMPAPETTTLRASGSAATKSSA